MHLSALSDFELPHFKEEGQKILESLDEPVSENKTSKT